MSALDTLDRCPHERSAQKSVLACRDTKKEDWRKTKLRLLNIALNTFHELRNKGKLPFEGKSRGPPIKRVACIAKPKTG